MKRLFFFSCMMFMVINIMAYQPIVVEGYNWNVVNRRAQLDGNNTTE